MSKFISVHRVVCALVCSSAGADGGCGERADGRRLVRRARDWPAVGAREPARTHSAPAARARRWAYAYQYTEHRSYTRTSTIPILAFTRSRRTSAGVEVIEQPVRARAPSPPPLAAGTHSALGTGYNERESRSTCAERACSSVGLAVAAQVGAPPTPLDERRHRRLRLVVSNQTGYANAQLSSISSFNQERRGLAAVELQCFASSGAHALPTAQPRHLLLSDWVLTKQKRRSQIRIDSTCCELWVCECTSWDGADTCMKGKA